MRWVRLGGALLIVCLAAGVALPSPVLAVPILPPRAFANAEAAWLGTWQNRLQIRVPSGSVSSTLTNFPLLVHLSAASGTNGADLTPVFDELTADANRNKIAITTSDGTTQCYVEIESWSDATEEAWLWFNAPSITTGENTFYLYYDVDQAANTTYVGDTGDAVAENVWNSNYVAVWHMNQTPDGDSGDLIDSTANDHDGTSDAVDDDFPDPAASVIGNGLAFDGNTGTTAGHRQWISVPDSDGFSATTTNLLTVQFWFHPNVTDWYDTAGTVMDYVNFLGKGNTSQFEWVWTVGGQNSPNKPWEMAFYGHDLAGSSGPGAGIYKSWALNAKIFHTGLINKTAGTISERSYYPDGTVQTDQNNGLGVNDAINGTAPLVIGGNWAVSQDQYLKSRLDEIRIMNNSPGAAWLDADYLNQQDDLLYFGAGALPQSVDIYVAAAGDDVNMWWNGSAWAFDTDAGYILLGYYGATEQKGGSLSIFQPGTAIPAGVTWLSANVSVRSAWNYANNTVTGKLTGVLSQNVTAPTDAAGYKALRGTVVGGANNNNLTTANVSWTPVPAFSSSTWYTSPDLADVMNEISALGALSRFGIFLDDHAGDSTASDATSRFYEDRNDGANLGMRFQGTYLEGTSPPAGTTGAASGETSTTANVAGTVTSLGSATSVSVYFEYGETTSYGSQVAANESPVSGTGAVSGTISGLSASTGYHYRLKMVGDETAYGADAEFTTEVGVPTVSTGTSSLVTTTSATVAGNITATGGENCTARGFEWDTDSGAPYANSVNATGNFGTGAYTLGLTGLPSGTTIYYRAWATNTAGTGYGSEQTFATEAETIPSTPADTSATGVSAILHIIPTILVVGMVMSSLSLGGLGLRSVYTQGPNVGALMATSMGFIFLSFNFAILGVVINAIEAAL